MKKKILVLAMAFAMTFVFAACGGGGAGAPAADTSAEPNTGVGGIVFTVPNGWTQDNSSPGSYIDFKIPDTGYMLGARKFDEESLKEYNEWSDEKLDSVQAYYDKNYALDKKTAKKNNIDTTTVKVVDNDATYNKYNDKTAGLISLSTYWMKDNTIYSIYMFDPNSYDDEGNIRKDAESISNDLVKEYEAVVASVKDGDGTALQKEALAELASSIGEFTYDIPEGFSVTSASDTNVDFEKDGTDISLSFSMTDESALADITEEDGSHPESLEAYFDADGRSEEDAKEIAGYKGFVYEYPDENDKYYNVSAEFMTENAIYDIYMGSDAYDENGDVKDGATELSKDDLAAFDSFIASIRKK